jgi:hypothetical protein
VPSLVDQLREARGAARAAGDTILTRAADEGRDLTPDELAEVRAHATAEREASDRIEQAHAAELAELRAATTRRNNVLSRQALDTVRAFRSAIYAKNPAPIEVYSDLPDEWPDDFPEVQAAAPAASTCTPATPSRAPRRRRWAWTSTGASSSTWWRPAP